MLKINKILSKKIKSPLSLRGLFPFCHSRESGNPSSLSLRGAKRRSNLSGFSLIELMVAVAILAMALFGIFNAFSSGWMGMANARDRTVATNYAQEILEDIKNTPFEKIHSESTSKIDDTKFSRNINSININPNIKEVTTQVTWKDWRGSVKNVEASTLIYSQFSSKETSDAVELILYAKPYYNILPTSTNTMLTVLVQDKNGNLVTDGEKDILFLVEDPLMGDVLPSSIKTQNGKATVFFIPSGIFGDVVIDATSPGLKSDSVTLKITDAAVAIKLEAVPEFISTGGEESIITVSLLDASYIDPPPLDKIDEHLVIFDVKEGPGTITGPISVLLNKGNGGTSSTTLTSTGTPGIVTIIASSMDLESGLVNILVLGSAESISIIAIPSSIFLDEYSDIIITIKDGAGNPVSYSGNINLSLSDPSKGSLSGGEDYNEETGTLTFSNESSKTITFTTLDAGEVNITASVADESLLQDTVTIYISKGRKIKLTAEPESIIAYGESSSTITATIVDVNNEIVTNEIYEIVFVILSGEGVLSGLNPQSTVGGVAEMTLISTSEPGDIITVSARAMGLTPDSIDIQTIYPKFISISADSNLLYINEKEDISITVLDIDSEEIPAAYSGNINLTLSGSGSGSFNPESPLYYPTDTTTVFTALSAGGITITADGDDINSDFITIQILEKITFEDNITTPDSGNTITFDISVGGVALEIVQMNITWDSLSTLSQICFSTTGPCFVYDPVVNSGDLIIIEPIATLPFGVSTISLYFSGDMNGKTITVIFFDSNFAEYSPLIFTIE